MNALCEKCLDPRLMAGIGGQHRSCVCGHYSFVRSGHEYQRDKVTPLLPSLLLATDVCCHLVSLPTDSLAISDEHETIHGIIIFHRRGDNYRVLPDPLNRFDVAIAPLSLAPPPLTPTNIYHSCRSICLDSSI